MSFRSNLHCHSLYSDGNDTLEEMVKAAIAKGFVSLGFSEHAYAPYDPDCCIKQDDIQRYYRDVAELKRKYGDRLEIYLGFESDYFLPAAKEELDFTIGSVHYLHDEAADAYYNIDYLPEMFEKCRDLIAGGDIRRMVSIYFDQVADMAETYRPDIVGHMDLIVKLNRGGRYFDEGGDWYRQIAGDAAERIAKTGCIVEVNTGAIQRGYRDTPYPSAWLLGRLRELGAPVTISSDAHSAEALDFWFEEAVRLLKSAGYCSAKQLRNGRFIDVEL